MKMIKKMTMGFLLAGTLALGACNTQKKAQLSETNVSLENVTWRLVELEGKTISEKINGKTPSLTLQKDELRYSAVTGCNGIGGNYVTMKGQLLTFSGGMSTRMYCEGAMEVENGLGKIFPQVYRYEIKENQLSLKDDDQKTLAVFTLMP